MKKIIFVISVIFLITIIVLVIFFGLDKGTKKTPSPTPSQGPLQDTANPGVKIETVEEEENKRSFFVGNLINKLPYKGQNFSLYYDFSQNQFILYINPRAISLGNTEFDTFLKQNDIVNRSWIENLTTVGQQTTPGP